MGAAWAWHAMCESALNGTSSGHISNRQPGNNYACAGGRCR